MTKKYTVVYCGPRLDYNTRLTHYKHIEGESLKQAMETSDIDWSAIWFVFDGHCQPTEE